MKEPKKVRVIDKERTMVEVMCMDRSAVFLTVARHEDRHSDQGDERVSLLTRRQAQRVVKALSAWLAWSEP